MYSQNESKLAAKKKIKSVPKKFKIVPKNSDNN